MNLTHKYMSVDDIKLHYVEARPDKSPRGTIVFLHGFPEYWASWQAQLKYFATDYRVIAPDLMGYNLSDKPKDLGKYQVPNLIALYAHFIQQVSPEQKTILVAHDWGGAIAWPLAAFHSDLIEKLIILNAAHPSTFTREMRDNPEQRRKSAYIHQLQANNAEQVLADNNFQFLRAMLFDEVKKEKLSEEWKQGYLNAWQQPGAVNAMANYYRAMPQLAADGPDGKPVPDKQLANIKIPQIRVMTPTLILWGEQDKAFVPDILDAIEEFVPVCSTQRFANASHWLHHEQPDAVNKAIKDFLTS